MTKFLNIFSNTKLHIAIIITLTFLAYSSIFPTTFYGDDQYLLKNWTDIKTFNIQNLLFARSFPEPYARYRPIDNLFIAINYHFWGPNQYGYHLVFLLLHILNAILVYLIVKQILIKSTTGIKTRDTLAFLTSLLFSLHPLNVETVNFMLANVILGFTFFLGSFYLYLKAKEISPIGPISPAYSEARQGRLISLIPSLILATAAFYSYELTLGLPLVILLYDFCFKNKSLKLLKSLRVYLPYFLAAASFLFVRYGLLHISDGTKYLANSFFLTMLVSLKVFLRVIELMVWPVNLSINHVFSPGIQSLVNSYSEPINRSATLRQSPFEPEVLLSLAVLGILGWLGIKFRKKFPLITFTIGWLFINFLPTSNLLPQSSIFQERYAYLETFSFVLLLAWVITTISNFKSQISNVKSLFLVSCILFLVSFYGIRTYLRNQDWYDPISMWSNLVKQLPNDGATNFYLATLYDDKGQKDQALNYYQKALSISPKAYQVYLKIGHIYAQTGQKQLALDSYLKAVYGLKFSGTHDLQNQLIALNVTLPDKIATYDGIWQKYQNPKKMLSFYYPANWIVNEDFEENIVIKSQKQDFYVQLSNLPQAGSTKSSHSISVSAHPPDSPEIGQLDSILASLKVL